MNEADVLNLLDKEVVDTASTASADGDVTFAKTSKKDYHELKQYSNVTSYSMLLELHACPRKLQLSRYKTDPRILPSENIDFAFGHAVGAGVQSLFHTKDLPTAVFNSYMAWDITFDARNPKNKKSIWEAIIAVEKFLPVLQESLDEWQLVYIGEERKPGIELSFSLDCNNGYKHYGHIDVVLRNIVTSQVAVIELKTTGLKYAEEAVYANSSQALGYSVILDALFPGLSSYEVFHFIYSSTDREWTAMPFSKTVSHKAEWIKDLLLDHATIDEYERIGFYPKRGESCYNYFRRCDYFGSCNLTPDTALPRLEPGAAAELVDFELNLDDVIRVQKERLL